MMEVITMQTEIKLTVRYAETDMMGIVHHSRYFPWFEAARTELIKLTGTSYSEMERGGIMLPLSEAKAKYISGLRYEDIAVVTVKIEKLTVARCVFSYEVYRESADGTRELCATGETIHGITDTNLRPLNLKKRAPELWEKMNALCGG